MKVVLLHAFPLDERMWRPQEPALAAHDVLAPNLYELEGNTMEGWAGQLLGRFEEPFVPVGASMGGYVALAMARAAPDRVRGIVLAGSRLSADSAERRAGRADTIELIEEEGPSGLWADQRDKLFAENAPAEAVELAQEAALARQVPELVRAIEAIRDRPDSATLLGTVSVLLAVGASDQFFPVEEAQEVAARAADSRLVVFDRSRHLPNLEQPGEFNLMLTAFLREVG
jgi:pimeloyl-ACP methyl ester carboxylesterase